MQDVYGYVQSLQNSVETWYKIFNPNLGNYFSETETYWLDKINRQGINPVASLIMVFFENEKSEKRCLRLLKAVERFRFITTMLSYRYHYGFYNTNFIELATELSESQITTENVITSITEINNKIYNDADNKKAIKKSFKNYGFYAWDGIRYFLYEYDLSLYEKSKTKRIKFNWEKFNDSDYKTVEHIFP